MAPLGGEASAKPSGKEAQRADIS